MIRVRPEQPGDIDAVRTLNEKAFEQPMEAGLVDRIRAVCGDVISLVAESDGRIVGHIFFSPVTIANDGREVRGMGLAPMALEPGLQRRGIGSRLVEAGLETLRRQACPFVIVLGHPEYYPRFGFAPASEHGLACQWEGVPDEAFMAVILDEEAMAGVTGVARYRDEFDEAI